MRKFLVALLILVILAAIVWVSRAPSPTPNPAGGFSFAVLGDAPYYVWEEWQYDNVLEALDAHDLSAVIHVGDIFWRPCSDAMYRRTLEQFNALRHPVILTPGDNEWTDCWEPGSGAFAPLERLNRIREIFFSDPNRSLGRKRITLVSQSPEFVENARWEMHGVRFVTVHLTGSKNAMKPFPNRMASDDAESRRRTLAATEWLREAFREARDARAIVVAFHANPDFDGVNGDYRQAYEPFVRALEEEAAGFARPVLVVQADAHEYIVDQPLPAQNVTRMQVPGSPDVGWVRVIVTRETTFAFEKHIVPRWKYW